jgi:hypothetical protein
MLSLSLVLLLTSCTNNSLVELGSLNDPEQKEITPIYLNRLPDCEFDVLALIQISGGYFSRSSLLQAFRQRAAQVGADALQIIYVQKLGVSEFYGNARALRCHTNDYVS